MKHLHISRRWLSSWFRPIKYALAAEDGAMHAWPRTDCSTDVTTVWQMMFHNFVQTAWCVILHPEDSNSEITTTLLPRARLIVSTFDVNRVFMSLPEFTKSVCRFVQRVVEHSTTVRIAYSIGCMGAPYVV